MKKELLQFQHALSDPGISRVALALPDKGRFRKIDEAHPLRIIHCFRGCRRYQLSTEPSIIEIKEGEVLAGWPGVPWKTLKSPPYASIGILIYSDRIQWNARQNLKGQDDAPLPIAITKSISIASELKSLWDNQSQPLFPLRLKNTIERWCLDSLSVAMKSSSRLGKSDRTWLALLALIEESQGLELNRESLAKQLKCHPNHLSRLAKTHGQGKTLNQLINDRRILEAESLLRSGQHHVNEIARLCGYQDAPQFISHFKRRHGVTPGKY